MKIRMHAIMPKHATIETIAIAIVTMIIKIITIRSQFQ